MHLVQSRCYVCPTQYQNFCSVLDEQSLAELERMSRPRRLKPRDVLFHDGDISSQYYNITSGAIKLVKTLADGNQHIVGILFPPEFIGQSLNAHHTYSAEAATEVDLCCYPRAQFEAFLVSHPALEKRIFEMTIRELDLCRDWTLLLARKCSYERVAGFILMMASRVPPFQTAPVAENSAHFQMPFTRAEIADYLGLTLETVSRQFSRLRRKRIISLPSSRDIFVPDLELLGSIAKIETCSEGQLKLRYAP